MDINLIKEIIESSIKSFKTTVIDSNGTGDHFNVLVVSDDFNNMILIERHKLVYHCLKEYLTKEIHALQLKTLTIKEYEDEKE